MVKKQKCLRCKEDVLNCDTLVDPSIDESPKEGQYYICPFCANIMVFDKKLNVIKVKKNDIPEDVLELSDNLNKFLLRLDNLFK